MCSQRENNIKATRPTVGGDITEAEADAIQAEEQHLIDTGMYHPRIQLHKYADVACDLAEPLTEEEKADKEEAIQEGFPNWSRREQQRFISACVEHGRNNMEIIAETCERTLEDTQRYADTFWRRYTEIPGKLFLMTLVQSVDANNSVSQTIKKRLIVSKRAKGFEKSDNSKSMFWIAKSRTLPCHCRRLISTTLRTRASNTVRTRTGSYLSECTITA